MLRVVLTKRSENRAGDLFDVYMILMRYAHHTCLVLCETYFVVVLELTYTRSRFPQVALDSRFTSKHFCNCYMSVNATNVSILKPSPFSPRSYSYKSNHAGWRYEIAVRIYNSQMFWVKGPFRSKGMNDVQIFRQDVRRLMSQNERVVADIGYPDWNRLRLKHVHASRKNVFMRICSCHETVNAILKRLIVLTISYGHGAQKNQTFF